MVDGESRRSAGRDLVGVVQLLVQHPRAVRLLEPEPDRPGCLQLAADASDRGRLIGRRGRTIQALRRLLAVRGRIEASAYDLELADG